ncbi:lysozyme [Enterobacter cloacae]|uniref:lysozyme n=1 Tax=Enterobacter cloacae TaxID=550 RepID=UPI0013EF73B4|nr:lysozyme [Enterobacter cloacae]
MRTSERGKELIKSFEGLRLQSYQCLAGIWTIGYGHTKNVSRGDVMTRETAEHYFNESILQKEQIVKKFVMVSLNQQQFDALVSFVFNLGEGNFRRSTLLQKINQNDFAGASQEFKRWIYANGKQAPGLLRRRKAEEQLFSQP